MKNRSQALEVLKQLTLEEKARLVTGKDFWHVTGVPRLGIEDIMITDGPHGLRKQAGDSDHVGLNDSVPATCFPTAVAMASSWDLELLGKVGEALAEECLKEEVSVLLGPGINIKRSQLCGRNFEYFSEDPFVAGEMSSALIAGIQSKGVGTSIKHFAVNNQEGNRMTIDANVDERTLREIYLAGFEKAIKRTQPWTVMCSYNQVNHTFASENKYLLTDILRDEWGFEGLTVTDWGASNDRIKGIKAGLDLEMPGPNESNVQKIMKSVEDQSLSIEDLDARVLAVLELLLRSKEAAKPNFTYDADSHHVLAREVSEESAVLLKNEGSILPLDINDEILVVGDFWNQPRYQGSGSSLINPMHLVAPKDGHPAPEKVTFAQGYDIHTSEVKEALLTEAVEKAKSAKKVVILAGLTDLYESEGFDRKDMAMPKAHDLLIEKISEVNDNVIVVLSNGSPVEMPWIDSVKAVLEMYLFGEAGGEAVWNLIYGKVNPSGKLAETFPIAYQDTLISELFPMGPKAVNYREGLYVGYRYYDTVKKDVLFPFGFGLSYTTFAYKDLKVEQVEDKYQVTFKVKNTGNRFGKEIAQVYVKDVASTFYRPNKELKGYQKVALEAGEEKLVTVVLDQRAFACYNPDLKQWVVEKGAFVIEVGASINAVHMTETIQVDGYEYSNEEIQVIQEREKAYRSITAETRFSHEAFETLYGSKIVPIPVGVIGSFSSISTVEELRVTKIGEILFSMITKQMESMFSASDEKSKAMFDAMLAELPLRSLGMMSGGKLNGEVIDLIVKHANGTEVPGLEDMFK